MFISTPCMCMIVNVKNDPYDVYIGRNPKYGDPKWGNPYSHLEGTLAKYKVDTREEAIEKYEEYLRSNKAMMDSIMELDGKILGCHCKPKACHGDVLLRLINEARMLNIFS